MNWQPRERKPDKRYKGRCQETRVRTDQPKRQRCPDKRTLKGYLARKRTREVPAAGEHVFFAIEHA